MLDKAPSAIKFKTTIKDITWMKPTVTVAEKIHDVKISVCYKKNKNGRRPAGRWCFDLCRGMNVFRKNLCWRFFRQRMFASRLPLKPVSERSPMIPTCCMT